MTGLCHLASVSGVQRALQEVERSTDNFHNKSHLTKKESEREVREIPKER